MPGIADMLVQSALESSKPQPLDLGGAVTRGAQLGAHIQEVQNQRVMIEQKKQELQMQKAVAVTDTLKIAASSKDKRLKDFLLKKVMPGKIKALGMEEFFPPQTLEMVQTSDSAMEKVLGLQLDLEDRVNKGEMSGAQAYQKARQVLSNPEELALFDGDRLFEAQKFNVDQSNRMDRTALVQSGQAQRQQTQIATVGDVELKKDVAKSYNTWVAGGGLSAREKAKNIFESAINRLRNRDVVLGTVGKNIPWVGNPEKFPLGDEKAKALLDDIRGGISIREKTGDPNPTQTQIDSIMNRIIDPRLSNEENIKKLEMELNAMNADTKNKVNTFKRFGYGAEEPQGNKSDKKDGKSGAFKKLSAEAQALVIKKKAAATGKSEDQVRKELEAE